MNENGYCPNCGLDFDGESIFDSFLDKYKDRQKALEVAEMYGATETKGHWDKKIGLYSMERDRTVMYRCPQCEHEWKRDD